MESEDLLFADLDIDISASDDNAVKKPSTLARQQARARMKQILAGEIDISTIEIPMERMVHINSDITEDVVRVLTKQLGFTPRNLVEVSRWHPREMFPQVLKLYPLNQKDPTIYDSSYEDDLIPFPTMYWISCPVLHAEISHLEESGWVQRLTERLLHSSESEIYLKAMEDAHKKYAEERWSLLSLQDQEFVIKSGW